MRRALTLSILVVGFAALSLTGCGGGGSSITGPTLLEVPDADAEPRVAQQNAP